jgi:hypothetical protein
VGSRVDDFRATATEFRGRGRRAEEQIAVMRRIWAGEPLGADVGPIGPRPVQPGGPELLLGGAAPAALRRAVVLRQLQDQGPRCGRERRAPRPAAPTERGPLATDQLAVPAEESLRPNRERRPVDAREATTQSSEHQPVARAPGNTLRTAPQDPYFVAQREKLEVARCVTLTLE